MMSRVCFNVGSLEAAAHMKGDELAKATANKKTAFESNLKKAADNSN